MEINWFFPSLGELTSTNPAPSIVVETMKMILLVSNKSSVI